MLEITNFSKTYRGGKRAVKSLNLRVHPGDICGFIGHNGAGKTTTLKAIAGILPFEEGDITLYGTSVKQDPVAVKSHIAFIPDNPDLYEYLTGIQYLTFVADVYRVPAQERDESIRQYAEQLELYHNLGDLIRGYSHGMKQKLALISALIHKPKLMLLDEPFVGLDPKAAHTLKQIMHGICAQGSAILFSTHVLEVAEKLCNRIAIIKNGELVAQGRTEEVTKNQSLESVFLELYEDA